MTDDMNYASTEVHLSIYVVRKLVQIYYYFTSIKSTLDQSDGPCYLHDTAISSFCSRYICISLDIDLIPHGMTQARDLPKILVAGYRLIPYFIFDAQEGWFLNNSFVYFLLSVNNLDIL